MKKYLLLLVFICGIITGYAQSTVGLIAHWNMNGSTNDVSGNGHNGNGNNITPAAGEGGVANTAYYFNGYSSYITIPYSPAFNLTQYSICAKVNVMGFYNGICDGNIIFE